MLRLKINELRSSIHTAQVRVKNIDDIRTHIITLQRQLTLERTKVQALSEELENPQNYLRSVSYTHLRAHETPEHLVCRLLLEKKKTTPTELLIFTLLFNTICHV
eukprot:TRINITY_DN7096_c0_g1_i3.p1 TRINITY_DN7096_c0_g1~~TRINITY_DN7096_c0_g1_i3.p1  ORF type:complete len:105 (-),score=27.34 TRINITY_DN7096_c0_g1_i3:73-387(-)